MRGISKSFGATRALADVSLAVGAGEVVALVGENGAGKSTLMKVLSGALSADAGTMRLDGAEFRPRGPGGARRAGVAMIYQELSLAPHLTVEENIALGAEPSRRGALDRASMRARALAALAQLEHPEIAPWARTGALPLPAQQLVEIARAIATGARVLVLDEPTGTLSQSDVERLFALIRLLRGRGHAIVYISHFLEEVLAIADRFVVLRDGRTVAQGATRGATAAQIADLMVGRSLGEMYVRSAHQPGEVVLETFALSGRARPSGSTLRLRRGEVLGIAGLVGAGRTELLRCVFGLDVVRSGRVRVASYEGRPSPRASLAAGMGLLSEDRKTEGLAMAMSIGDNMTLSRPSAIPGRRMRAAQEWIGRLAVRCRGPRQAVASLSGGNQQKVALARLLYHDADVLLLDEPTRGIDVGSKAQIYRLIDELVSPRDGGAARKAVLLVSSSLPELLGVCDRIAVMCRGRLGEARSAAEWTEHSLMLAAGGVREEAA
jgi:ribose transport system ATP-binding protein